MNRHHYNNHTNSVGNNHTSNSDNPDSIQKLLAILFQAIPTSNKKNEAENEDGYSN